MKSIAFIIVLIFSFHHSQCSVGNQSPFFSNCLGRCLDKNCLIDGEDFRMDFPRPFYMDLLGWSCGDECNYDCMWKTVEGFQSRNYKIPQFYGKWPFIRFLGMQEPASTLFSLFNLYAHVRMLKKLKDNLRPDTPLRWMWFAYGLVSIHAWVWSAIFHAKDVELTEFMDYSSAFSIVLMSCYTMVIRVLRKFTKLNVVITIFFIMFLVDHIMYLRQGRFDYGYNMKANVLTGLFTVISWLVWSLWNRKKMNYLWKIRLYVILIAVTTLLELVDVPPILWCFDCHAIWHLSTVPLHFLFYSFVIDDCKYLRNEEMKYEKLSTLQ